MRISAKNAKYLYLLVGLFSVFFLSAAFQAAATPPASPYIAGETLDPTCSPGDPNCYVTPISIGTFVGSGTAGSIPFIDSTGELAEDNTALFWDETNDRLGIGTNSPQFALDVSEETVPSSMVEDNTSVTGLEDMTIGGTYTGLVSDFYCVVINDDVTVPNTFDWYDDSCGNFVATLPITAGVAQTLANGVTVTFASDAGHTNNDVWFINLTPATYVGDINFGGNIYNDGALWSGIIGGNVIGASANIVPFVDGSGVLSEDTSFYYENLSTRLNVNNIRMPATTALTGVIYRDNSRFLHSYGTNNTFLGQLAGNLSLTTGSAVGNTAVGASALDALTTGDENVAIGLSSLGSNQTGSDNTAIGVNSMIFNISGSSNVAIGRLALQRNTASNNVAVGTSTFQLKGSGDGNVGIGGSALFGATTNYSANYNVGVGYNSLLLIGTGADYNVAIGEAAGEGGGGGFVGSRNVLVGRNAGTNITSASNNTIIGSESGTSLNNGNNNILIGYTLGSTLETGSNNILIGDTVDVPLLSTSNYLSIGDIIFGDMALGNVGIGDASPLAMFTVGSGDLFQIDSNGDINLNQATPVITVDNGSTLNILNEDGDNLFSLTDYNNVFGSVAESGAFVSRQSYFGEEFSRERASIAADANQAWGDFQAWGVDETNNCAWEIVDDTINGIGRMRTNAAAAGNSCLAYKSAAAGNAHLEYNVTNLPVIYMKAKAFGSVSATSNLWIGLGDAAAGSTTAPTNGIFFENNGGTDWVGTTRLAGTSTNVACSTAISTTNYALLKIEVLSATSVRFSIDADVTDGVSFTTCGTSATNIPVANLTTMIKSSSNATNTGVDVDFFRVWQDDNESTSLDTTLDETPSADEYEVWLEEKSEDYVPEGGALEELSQKLADGFAWVEEYIFNRITALVGVFDRIESRRVETVELCVGSLCVTEEEFLEVFSDSISEDVNTENSNPDGGASTDLPQEEEGTIEEEQNGVEGGTNDIDTNEEDLVSPHSESQSDSEKSSEGGIPQNTINNSNSSTEPAI